MYTVNDTSYGRTILNPGLGTVQVNLTDGELDIQGGQHVTVGNGHFKGLFDYGRDLISGLVNVTNPAGNGLLRTMDLTIDDSLDTVGRTIALASQTSTSSAITGLNYAGIDFNPNNLTALTIKGGNGGNTFNIQATGAGIATIIKAGAGGDTVNIGSDPVNLPQSILDGIQGAVSVTGTGGNTTLNFNDQGGSPGSGQAYSYTLEQDSFSRTGTATVTFTGLKTVNVNGANAGNSNVLSVDSTLPGTTYNVNAGTTGNQFIVEGDKANNGTLNGIQGPLFLHGNGLPGLTTVRMYDILDPTPQTFLLNAGNSSQSGMVQRSGSSLPGSPPDMATISYDGVFQAFLETANAYSSSGLNGDNVLVQGNAPDILTYVLVGTGDSVTVGNTSHTMDGISGDLRIQNALSPERPTVFLDDAGDKTSRTITMGNDPGNAYRIRGLLPSSIPGRGNLWVRFGDPASNVTVLGGSPPVGQPGGNTYDIESVAGISLTLKAGSGADTVNVGSDPVNLAQSILGGIQGAVTVTGTGTTTLNFNDEGSNPGAAPNQAFNYSLSQNSFSRTGTAAVTFTGIGTVNVYAANAAGSGGFNLLAVASTAPGTSYNVNAGTGLNEFLVWDSNHTLNGIQGPLFLHGAGGSLPNDDLVELGDVDKTIRHTLLLNAGATSQSATVQRLNTASGQPDMATINYDGINAYCVLNTVGSAGATVDVQSEASDASTVISAGNGDTVNISSPSHTMAGILGDVAVQNAPGQKPTVIVDDSKDNGPRTIDMSNGANGYLVAGLLPPSNVGLGRLWFQLDSATPVSILAGSPPAGQPGGNTFDIESVPAGISLAVNTGKGADTVNVGSDPVNLPQSILDGVQGAVTVTGTGGNTTLNFNDQGGNPGPGQAYSYTLEQDTFSRTGTATVTFTGMTTVNVNGANAGNANVLSVASTLPGTTYNVNAGTGGNQFIVAGDKANNDTLNGIQGPLFLHGNGLTTVSMYDILDPTPQTFTLTAGTTSQSGVVKRSGSSLPGSLPDMAAISYDGILRAALETANAYSSSGLNGDTVLVQGNAPNIFTNVLVGTGDTVTVGTTSHTMDGIFGDLRIQNALAPERPMVILDDAGDKTSRTITMGNDPGNGYRFTAYLFTGLLPSSIPGHGNLWVRFGDPAASVALKTGAGDDVFKVTDFTNAPTLTLDAGGGTNTLDYSTYKGNVQAILPLGVATGFAGGIKNIENVTGSQGNNLLVGDANPNVLIGGTGRNVIIGGAGADTLDASGATSDNILIGGTTDFDTNLAALDVIFAEWTRTDLAFRDRFSDLSNGSNGVGATPLNKVNGQMILLTNTTVHADTSPDTLTGSNQTDPATGKRAQNWFFFDADDTLVNFLSSSDHKTKVK
jgi:hypothetical protein